MDVGKLAKQIFDEYAKDGEPVTMEEALEVAKMEIKAKSNGRHYEKSNKPVVKKAKPRKVDKAKKEIFEIIKTALEEAKIPVLTEKTETEVGFKYGEDSYTLKLTKHRKKQ